MILRTNQTYRARWIIPGSGQPINSGWLRFVGNQIEQLGRGEPPEPSIDLGDLALLPELVNAHTHLEFSDRSEPIGSPGTPLWEWIGKVVATRQASEKPSADRIVQQGIDEVLATGTGVVGEIATPPIHYATIDFGDLAIISFAEVVGLSKARYQERLHAASNHLAQYAYAGVSPHAPYSLPFSAIESCLGLASQYNRTVAMHVAESPAERELLSGAGGPFAEALRSLGVWRENCFPWSAEPIQELIKRLSIAPRFLLVHGNDLTPAEIRSLAEHDHGTVVYCPRTHEFFGYESHPVDRLLAAGVRVALGTDSRASNPDLNLWKEVQWLLQNRSDLDPADVISMATTAGADALGYANRGRLKVGSQARLGMVATNAGDLERLYEDLATHPYEPALVNAEIIGE